MPTEPKTKVPGSRWRALGIAGPVAMMMPEKSSSGMAGLERKRNGQSCINIEAPGLRAACVMRTRTSIGEVREGHGSCGERVRTSEGVPACEWTQARIVVGRGVEWGVRSITEVPISL